MTNLINKYIEQNKKNKTIVICIALITLFISLFLFIFKNDNYNYLNLGISFIFISFTLIMLLLLLSNYFSKYEKYWLLITMILAAIISFLFPEEDANGVNGVLIMLLYLGDIYLNILCELLISKQSRYNFIVSILIEILEIITCIVLMYRFATMAVTLFFWLPVDVVSFIIWSKHKDDKQEELTVVRKLSNYQLIFAIVGIILWTIVVGYFISGLNIQTDFIENRNLKILLIYLDACVSAVGIANGIFILFRLREQWYAWYIYTFLDTIINILSGQYILLVLKLGFIINTTYGYIKWTKYIKTH